jgi:D-sedoheptulose 7-phosphate isomerase
MTVLDKLTANCPALEECRADIRKAYDLLYKTFSGGGRAYVCGNGGSASDCMHITGELMKGFLKKREVILPPDVADKLTPRVRTLLSEKLQGALPCHSLVSETALITALCNDISSDIVFAQQVFGYGRPGDCLIAISTSGEAENVCLAAELARAMMMDTVALTGRNGGRLAALCGASVRVPADTTAEVQEYHLPVYHALCAALEDALF